MSIDVHCALIKINIKACQLFAILRVEWNEILRSLQEYDY